MSAASLIATHLNAPYGPVVTAQDVAESLRRGTLSASTHEANAILEALFIECEPSLIERAAAELGVPLDRVRDLREELRTR